MGLGGVAIATLPSVIFPKLMFSDRLGRGWCRPYPQLRCFAACSGFLMVGPALRNLAACGSLVVLRRLTLIRNFLPLATSVTV